jgi:methionine--tRNA ligase beta chain
MEAVMITFNDFKKLDIRIGKIISAEKIAGTDKLLKLEIDFGNEKRDVVAGIAGYYQPQEIIGKEIPVILNLEPRKIRGIESRGMVLAVDVDNKPVLLHPEKEVPTWQYHKINPRPISHYIENI